MNAVTDHSEYATGSGIWGSSAASSTEYYIIFCVGNDLVRAAQFRSWALENKIGFKSLKGCYEGVQEDSFIVNYKDLNAVSPWFKDEESILILGPLFENGRLFGARRATLVYVGNETRPASSLELGRFTAQPREYALKQKAWTYDPSTGVYYVAG